MTMTEAVKLIGTKAMLVTEGRVLTVPVTIMDAKTAYGAFRFTVTPVGGKGTVTVDASRLQFVSPEGV